MDDCSPNTPMLRAFCPTYARQPIRPEDIHPTLFVQYHQPSSPHHAHSPTPSPTLSITTAEAETVPYPDLSSPGDTYWDIDHAHTSSGCKPSAPQSSGPDTGSTSSACCASRAMVVGWKIRGQIPIDSGRACWRRRAVDAQRLATSWAKSGRVVLRAVVCCCWWVLR